MDFYNGTIFLPPEEYEISENDNPALRKVQVPKRSLDDREIETVVAHHTGKDVKLAAKTTYIERLTNIKQFWSKLAQLQSSKHRLV